jgi:hypothetical protein
VLKAREKESVLGKKPEERPPLDDLGVDGSIISKRIFKKKFEGRRLD